MRLHSQTLIYSAVPWPLHPTWSELSRLLVQQWGYRGSCSSPSSSPSHPRFIIKLDIFWFVSKYFPLQPSQLSVAEDCLVKIFQFEMSRNRNAGPHGLQSRIMTELALWLLGSWTRTEWRWLVARSEIKKKDEWADQIDGGELRLQQPRLSVICFIHRTNSMYLLQLFKPPNTS